MIRKIAIQIAGQIRPGWDECHQMWLNYYKTKPTNLEVDFFLSSWENDIYKGGSKLFKIERLDKESSILRNKISNISNKRMHSIVKYYERWHRVNVLREYYEHENDVSFDLVILVRPDFYIKYLWEQIDWFNQYINKNTDTVVLNDNLLWSGSKLSLHKNETAPQDEAYHFCDDKIFIGTPNVINYLTSISVEQLRGDKYPLASHVSLAHYLLDGRIVVEKLNKTRGTISRNFDTYQDYLER